ncbi:extracellular solute-binding protein [Anaerocolumna sp.]|uniref:extracellular solute-binding protein n=1 Tax=Anaerocolumna sp. TaxID=2041569 RepID=UPI0028A7DA3D|nr:extracellular solute-binding protein [Anaerocolumna sp.]
MSKRGKNIFGLGFILTGVICLVIIICLIQQKPNTDKPNRKEDGILEKEEDRITIRIGMWDIGDYLTGDEVLSYIEDKLHIKLEPVNVNYTNWTQEYQKMAASNSLPDIIVHDIVGSATYSAWVSQGKIQPVPSDLSAYPNFEAYMNGEYIQNFQEKSGELYLIPRLTYPDEKLWALDRCIVMRKDWLSQLNMELPQSYEELKAVLKAFTESDFDGDGEYNTIGLATENMNTLEAIYLSIFPELSNVERGWMKEEGKWIPVYASKRTGKALSYTKELYDLGLLDNEFAYRTIKEAFSLFTDGKAGAISCQYFNLLKHWKTIDNKKDYLDKIVVLKPWPAEDGNAYCFTSSLHWSELYLNAQIEDEKMNKILELFDFLLSEEAKQLFYQQNDSKWRENNPSIEALSTLVSWNQEEIYNKTKASIEIYGEANIDYAIELMNWYQENTESVHYNNDIIFTSTPSKLLLPTYQEIKDDMIRVVVGKEPAEEGWDKVLEKYRSETPLRQAIHEVTKLAELEGIE